MLPKIFLLSGCVLLGGFLAYGEHDTTIEKHPYEVSVHVYGEYDQCAGSLISSKVVLTAGRCAYRMPEKSLSVRAGSSYVRTEGEVKQVKKAISHPMYSPRTMDYDVAIFRLDSRLTSSKTVSPIKVIQIGKDVPKGTEATVSGWGKLPEDPAMKVVLQEEAVVVASHADCSSWYEEDGTTITGRMLCAGPRATLLRPDNGSCVVHKDAGGPLVAGGHLVGVVSFGTGCDRPAVFAKLSDFQIGVFIWLHT